VIDTLYKTRKKPEQYAVASIQASPTHPQDDSESESDSDEEQAEEDLSGSLEIEIETPAFPANPELYRETIT
jgi:hypothetical protein